MTQQPVSHPPVVRSRSGRLHSSNCLSLTNDGGCFCDEQGRCAFEAPPTS